MKILLTNKNYPKATNNNIHPVYSNVFLGSYNITFQFIIEYDISLNPISIPNLFYFIIIHIIHFLSI
jgi:hypothetical protein